MPYSWQSEAPGLHPDVPGRQETTSNTYFIHPQLLLFQQHCQKFLPWDTPGLMPYSWQSEAPGLHPDGTGHPETTSKTYFNHPSFQNVMCIAVSETGPYYFEGRMLL